MTQEQVSNSMFFLNETQEDNDSLKTSIQDDPEEDGEVKIKEKPPHILIKIQKDLLYQRKKSLGEAPVVNGRKDVRIHSRNILSSTINRRSTTNTN
jgi:hypothetical protein